MPAGCADYLLSWKSTDNDHVIIICSTRKTFNVKNKEINTMYCNSSKQTIATLKQCQLPSGIFTVNDKQEPLPTVEPLPAGWNAMDRSSFSHTETTKLRQNMVQKGEVLLFAHNFHPLFIFFKIIQNCLLCFRWIMNLWISEKVFRRLTKATAKRWVKKLGPTYFLLNLNNFHLLPTTFFD